MPRPIRGLSRLRMVRGLLVVQLGCAAESETEMEPAGALPILGSNILGEDVQPLMPLTCEGTGGQEELAEAVRNARTDPEFNVPKIGSEHGGRHRTTHSGW